MTADGAARITPMRAALRIRVGFDIVYECQQPTPMILLLHVHPSRSADLAGPEQMTCGPAVTVGEYLDAFGARCSRIGGAHWDDPAVVGCDRGGIPANRAR